MEETVINWVLSKWWKIVLEMWSWYFTRECPCASESFHITENLAPFRLFSRVFSSFSWDIKWNFYKLFVQLWLSGRHQFIDIWFIFVWNQWRKNLRSCVDREHFKAWLNYSLPRLSINRAYGCRTGIEKFFLTKYDRLRRFLHFNYIILLNLLIYAVRMMRSAQLSLNSVLFGTKAKVQLDIAKVLHTMQCVHKRHKNQVCFKRQFWLSNLHMASNKLPSSITSLDHFIWSRFSEVQIN